MPSKRGRPRRPSSTAAPFSETTRQWVHIASGAGALALRYVTWYQAVVFVAVAVVFNIRLLKTVTRARLHRPKELQDTLPAGLVLYPTSVLLLLLMLPSRPDIVAAAWGILAFGDGAATLVGRRYGGRKWPWNPEKSIVGSLALFVAGGAAGSFLAWWCREPVIPPPYLWFSIGAPFVAALTAAAVETVPIRLDDNLSVPLCAATVLFALAAVNQDLAIALARSAPPALAMALPANALFAAIGYVLRTVSKSGAIAGAIIGSIIVVAAGWAGWLLLLCAFACAAATSRVGLDRKSRLRIAQEHGGRRGAGSAIANTGFAAAAALVGAMSYAPVDGLIAFTAALTAGASDTVASEIGKALSRRTWGIVPPSSVSPGTPGGISVAGTVAGLTAAAALAGIALALRLIPTHAWLPVVAGAAVGSLVESLLAAALEPPGILDNASLNFINTAVAAFVAVSLAAAVS